MKLYKLANQIENLHDYNYKGIWLINNYLILFNLNLVDYIILLLSYIEKVDTKIILHMWFLLLSI
jgi:hypothetical protein